MQCEAWLICPAKILPQNANQVERAYSIHPLSARTASNPCCSYLKSMEAQLPLCLSHRAWLHPSLASKVGDRVRLQLKDRHVGHL